MAAAPKVRQLWGQQGNYERELPPHAADRYRPSLCQAARAKSFKLFDAGGLYLDVWYSRQIAKQQNLAAPRSAETIRKHMKK
jgi:hypothetical protein